MKKKHRIEFNKRFIKDLERIPERDRQKITESVLSLADDPRPSGCKKLRAARDLYRIRSGDYRIIYTVTDSKLLVLVIEVGHRKDIYRL